jgi:Spy/CpxP family protein refolding chaperone
MKNLLSLLLITAIFTTTAVAQVPNDTKKMQTRAEWNQKVKDELKLTAEQAEKYEALNKEYDGKFEAITQDASLSQEDQKEKIMALKKEKEAKLYEFLTPEQQTKYKELVDKKLKDMQQKKGS